MDQKDLIRVLKDIINKNFSDMFVLDVANDKVYKFGLNNNHRIDFVKEMTYSGEYIEYIQNLVHEEDLTEFFDSISIKNLEDKTVTGVQETRDVYRRKVETGEYRKFVNIIKYEELKGQKLIFTVEEDITDRLVENELKSNELETQVADLNEKMLSETQSLADAIYQVNNILEQSSSTDGVINTKDTRNYINTVFSNASLDHPELNKAISDKLTETSNYSKPTILICDDSRLIRNALCKIFENDYNILFAEDGMQAIELLKNNFLLTNNDDHINIVGLLLDLVMPNLDGFGVLDFMKENNLFNRIPVAIISSDDAKETKEKAYDYEIVDMLEKPFNIKTIRRRLGKIINLYMATNNMQSIMALDDISN